MEFRTRPDEKTAAFETLNKLNTLNFVLVRFLFISVATQRPVNRYRTFVDSVTDNSVTRRQSGNALKGNTQHYIIRFKKLTALNYE